jgi:hypothetical protein
VAWVGTRGCGRETVGSRFRVSCPATPAGAGLSLFCSVVLQRACTVSPANRLLCVSQPELQGWHCFLFEAWAAHLVACAPACRDTLHTGTLHKKMRAQDVAGFARDTLLKRRTTRPRPPEGVLPGAWSTNYGCPVSWGLWDIWDRRFHCVLQKEGFGCAVPALRVVREGREARDRGLCVRHSSRRVLCSTLQVLSNNACAGVSPTCSERRQLSFTAVHTTLSHVRLADVAVLLRSRSGPRSQVCLVAVPRTARTPGLPFLTSCC